MASTPLSNNEVLQVLQARKEHTKITKDFKEYLTTINPNEHTYKMDDLRNAKGLESSADLLCILANTQDISIIESSNERRKINDIIKK